MSFGFSPSDIISLINLTTKTYQGWHDACGEYADVTGTLNSLSVVLRRVDVYFEARGKASGASDANTFERLALERDDLDQVVGACQRAVEELRAVVRRYKSLGTSQSRNWDRIRLGNKDLSKLRAKLSQHVSELSAFLLTVELDSIGRTGDSIDRIEHEHYIRLLRPEKLVELFAPGYRQIRFDSYDDETDWARPEDQRPHMFLRVHAEDNVVTLASSSSEQVTTGSSGFDDKNR
ncbi:hypothetical protein LTR65_006774 [Meristemomyces frigidus]